MSESLLASRGARTRIQHAAVQLNLGRRQPRAGRGIPGGAFTTEREAQRLLAAMAQARRHEDLRINVVPVHVRLEDWEWDA